MHFLTNYVKDDLFHIIASYPKLDYVLNQLFWCALVGFVRIL